MDEQARHPSDCETLAALLPAYSIGATDAEETALVERLLPLCPEVAAELDDYAALAEGLHYAAPSAQPPAHLHDKIMVAAGAGSPHTAETVAAPAVRATPPLKAVEPPRRRLNRVLVGAVAIAAALLIISNLYWLGQVNTLRQQQQDTVALIRSQQDALASLGTGRAQRYQLVSTDETQADLVLATVLWSPQTPTALLYTDELPELAPERAYQLWVIRDSQPVSAGVFAVDDGVGVLVFNTDAPITEGNIVAITEEPAGGSDQPTSNPLAAAHV